MTEPPHSEPDEAKAIRRALATTEAHEKNGSLDHLV